MANNFMNDLEQKLISKEPEGSGYRNFVSQAFNQFKKKGLDQWILIPGDDAAIDHIYLPKISKEIVYYGYTLECGYRMSGVVLALLKV